MRFDVSIFKGASYLTLLLNSISIQMDNNENPTLAFERHCKIQHPTCTKKYSFDKIDGADYR